MTDPQTPELVVEPAATTDTTSRRIARTCGWVAWRWCTGLPMRQQSNAARVDHTGESLGRGFFASLRWSAMLLLTAVAVMRLTPLGIINAIAFLVALGSFASLALGGLYWLVATILMWVDRIFVRLERYDRKLRTAPPSEPADHCRCCPERGAR